MPDSRRHRGPHPADTQLFSPSVLPDLRAAVRDYSLLLTRGYAGTSALKLVGDRFHLTARQREAVRRSSCSDAAREARARLCQPLPLTPGERLGIDGYNVLITIESALSGGFVFRARDDCHRDLASIHGTYRAVHETVPALTLIGEVLEGLHRGSVTWYFDAPVSNSGRLAARVRDLARQRSWDWSVEVVADPDRTLVEMDVLVASSDSWILDHSRAWINLTRAVIESRIPEARVLDLREDGDVD